MTEQLSLMPEIIKPKKLRTPSKPTFLSKPDLAQYDYIIIAFSGGKDSWACLLHLLDLGVAREKIELWHHLVDGREGSTLMDWPITEDYCRAAATAFELPLYFSWKVGGFEREMLRKNARTAPIRFEVPGGEVRQIGGTGGKLGTRLKFPQVSGNLRVRWCSSYLKIQVAEAALRNQKRFRNARTLFITGERGEESTNRAKYATFEPHSQDRRDSKKLARHIDHWRPVHDWRSSEVWQIMQKYRVNPHPAYKLGWGRVSCMKCIFGSNHQWASNALIDRSGTQTIDDYEHQFGITISRGGLSVLERVKIDGVAYQMAKADILAARSQDYDEAIILPAGTWQLPPGAFGESCGPS